MAKAGRIFVPRSVSFPPPLLEQALERARNLGLPFSAYIQKCVERDLQERGAIIYHEKKPEKLLAAAEKAGDYQASPRRKRPSKR